MVLEPQQIFSRIEIYSFIKYSRKKCIIKFDILFVLFQARDMIAKVYEFMKHEASSEYAEKLTNARWRCAHACGVSEKTVTRILKEKRKAVAG